MVAVLAIVGCSQLSYAQTINTFAGGIGTHDSSAHIGLGGMSGVAYDTSNNLYVADQQYYVVRKITPSGIMSTFAGNGAFGERGDGGSATLAGLIAPAGVAADRKGNVYVSDIATHVVRKISSSGIITHFAGGNTSGFSGDGGPASIAKLNWPLGLVVDRFGNVFIADLLNNRIRKVDTNGIITTVVGRGAIDSNGDGGAATLAGLNRPSSICFDRGNNMYIADQSNNRIRKVNTLGIISTFAGGGTSTTWATDTLATSATIFQPNFLAIDGRDRLFFTDGTGLDVRYIDSAGYLRRYVGGGSRTPGYGDENPDSIMLYRAKGIAFDNLGNFAIATYEDHRLYKVSPAHILNNLAGNKYNSVSGNGGNALNAQLYRPTAVAVGPDNNVYVTDNENFIVRKIDNSNTITTFAGTGFGFSAGDGGPATLALLRYPFGITVDQSNNVYVGEVSLIRKINSAGIISTFAGAGTNIRNHVPAITTRIYSPYNMSTDNFGNILVANTYQNTAIYIDRDSVTNNLSGYLGGHSFCGDGGIDTMACLNNPYGVCRDMHGTFYIADCYNNRIRKIDTSGIITTFAGGNSAGYSGDGGPASSALLNSPRDVKVAPDGETVFFIDGYNYVIRSITHDGVINTVVGNGTSGYSGDGGPAIAAQLSNPSSIAFKNNGDLFIADGMNNRIRVVNTGIVNAVSNVSKNEVSFSIFPNPASDIVNFAISSKIEKAHTISVFDYLGHKVSEINIDGNSHNGSLNMGSVAKGIYLVQVHSEGALEATTRLVVQ